MYSISVFVKSINPMPGTTKYVIEASNGGREGPPFVRFEVTGEEARNLKVEDRLVLTLARPED